MRNTSCKLSILALVIVGALAMVPAASADSMSFDLFVGTTQVATATLTTGGSCASGICVTITATGSNLISANGQFVGFSPSATGDVSGIGLTSFSGSGTVGTTNCSDLDKAAGSVCFQVTGVGSGGGQVSSTTFVLTGVSLSDIGDIGLHVVSSACPGGAGQTCFATSTPVGTVPEPGTLGLLGTGLVGIAGLVRRRFSK